MLDDTQILRYVEGEADDAIVAHIKQCQFCAERANRLTLFQNRLRARLYRSTCPSSMELGDYHLGLLPASQLLVVAQHVRECPLCRREVAELESFLNDLVPEVSLMGTAKVLIARLISGQEESGQNRENGFTRSSVALRGEAKGPITLEADGIVIVLDVQPTNDGRVVILGQVAADDQDQWTEARVELHQGGELEFSTTLDDLGAFHSEDIMPGSKVLRIISKDSSRIVVSNFEVST